MNGRISDKIKELEESLDYLLSIIPQSYKEYSGDLKTKAASERYFEKIIEAVVDLAFLFIKEKKIELPEDDQAAFDVLAKGDFISQDLAKKFKDAKGMRNFIIHQYEKIDDLMVYSAIKEELENDIREFIRVVKQELE